MALLVCAYAYPTAFGDKENSPCRSIADEPGCSASSAGCTWWAGYGCYGKVEGYDKEDSGKDGSGTAASSKKAAPCNATHMLTDTDQKALEKFPRSCILSSPNNSPRCWWTYTPTAVATATTSLKVALVIDMHGGGGGASHQAAGSGFKELSDSLGADTFVTAWPQASASLWASCGADASACTSDSKDYGKMIATWDDITFLEQMIANLVKSNTRIDGERVYVSGFSMGCMMAHRLALERSAIVAGLGCHGGELSGVDFAATSQLATLKSRFRLLPMPVYLTIGDQVCGERG